MVSVSVQKNKKLHLPGMQFTDCASSRAPHFSVYKHSRLSRPRPPPRASFPPSRSLLSLDSTHVSPNRTIQLLTDSIHSTSNTHRQSTQHRFQLASQPTRSKPTIKWLPRRPKVLPSPRLLPPMPPTRFVASIPGPCHENRQLTRCRT